MTLYWGPQSESLPGYRSPHRTRGTQTDSVSGSTKWHCIGVHKVTLFLSSLYLDRIWNYSWHKCHMSLPDIQISLSVCRTYWVWYDHNNNKTKHKDVFQQFEFVDKNNLETHNPRRDTSILSVSTGLLWESLGRPLREPRSPPGKALVRSLKLGTYLGLVKTINLNFYFWKLS